MKTNRRVPVAILLLSITMLWSQSALVETGRSLGWRADCGALLAAPLDPAQATAGEPGANRATALYRHNMSPSFSVRRTGPLVEILHAKKAAPVLRFRPDHGFIRAAKAEGSIREVVDSSGLPRHGHYPFDYSFREKILESYADTKEWRTTLRPRGFTINGVLRGSKSDVSYSFTVDIESEHQLRFQVRVDPSRVNRVYLKVDSPANEHMFGLGEQFTFLDMKGLRVPLWVMEKGIGRGLEPLSSVLKLMRFPAPMKPIDELGAEIKLNSHFGEHSFGAYVPMPYFLSSLGRALVLENTEYSVFDFREADSAEIELRASQMSGRIFVGGTPKEALEAYTAYAGRMPRLPEWMGNGLMIGAGGGSAAVRRTVDSMSEKYSKLGIPITSVNIHDWQGTRSGDLLIARRLWWTFEADATLYPDWEKLVKELRARGIRVVTYFNPMMAAEAGELKRDLRRDVFKQARDAGYLVRKRDGTPYIVSSGIIKAGLIDLTNPKARSWFKDLMKEQVRIGVSGWMADFAEGLPHDAVLYSGEDPAAYHNRYPVEYAKLNREVLAEMGIEKEVSFHSRSGYTFSPRYSTSFFTGDQLNSWDEYDGVKTIVNALLSGGLSGIPFFLFSYGGFWTIIPEQVLPKLPVDIRERIPPEVVPRLRYENTPELMARRIELAVFGSSAMFGVAAPDDFFSRFATLFMELAPYRAQLVSEAAEKGLPLVRHLMLHYPDDPEVYRLKYEFMYGTEFIVRPVLDPGVTRVSVYLPAGRWVHLFTQVTYGRQESGVWMDVDAPLGTPAIFYKEGSRVGEELVKRLGVRYAWQDGPRLTSR